MDLSLHNLYAEFLDYLNATGVRYAVLHDWETLARGRTSDIDIILPASDLSRIEARLCEHYRILAMFHYEASSFAFVLAPKNHDATCLFIVDLSTDYRWRGRIFFTAEELLQRRRQWRGFWVVGPGQEFAYLLVKKIYEKGNIPAHQKERFEQLAAELGPQAQAIAGTLFGDKIGTRLVGWISRKQWPEVELRVRQLQRRLRWEALKRDHLNPVRYWLPELRRCWERWRYPTGLLVAMVDPKGAAKNGLAVCLKESLSLAFRRTALFRRLPNSYALAFLFRIRPLLVRSTLVILGGDSDGIYLDSLDYGSRTRSVLFRFTHQLVSLPSLFIILGASAAPLCANEEGPSEEDTRRQGRVDPQLVASQSYGIVLDSHLPAGELTRTACDVVMTHLNQRYLGRRHLWFPNNAP
jgi:hypothetical protein